MNTEENQKRQRVTRACDNCRRKKIRCNGEHPVCSNCQSFGMECTYNDTKKKRGPPKGYIEAIESRLHRMEHILGGLVQSDPRAAETVMSEMRRLEEEANSVTRAQSKVKPLEFREYRVPNAQIPDSPSEDISTTAAPENIQTNTEKNTQDISPSLVMTPSEPKKPIQMSPSFTLTVDPDVETLSNITDQLILDDEGRVRHCGKSSGLYLLQGSQKYQNDLYKIRPRVQVSDKRGDTNPNPTVLPSSNLFAYLMDVYFTRINPIFPLLHKAEFLKRLNQSGEETPYFLLNALFALSAALISSENILNKEKLDAEIFFKKCRALLDQAYDVSSIENVQGLILMSIYFHISHGGIKSWMYSGMAIRMAEDLGLHRNPDIWNINLTTANKETRKRVWWVCYLIDRFSSVCVGRPVSIDDQQFDTPLPTLTDEDMLAPIGVSPRSGLSLKSFLEVTKLHELIGRILSTMYIVRTPIASNYDKFHTNLIELDSALSLWLNSLPSDLAYIPTNYFTGNPPKSPTLIYAHVWYHCALILLHRPFILRPEPSSRLQSSSQICMDAANSLTNIVTSCVNTPGASDIVLFLLFPIFTASTIHLLQVMSPNQWIASSSRMSLFKNLDILKQIRERCGYAGRYYTILTDLINESNITPESEIVQESPHINFHNGNSNDIASTERPLSGTPQNPPPKSESLTTSTKASLSPSNIDVDFPVISPYVEGAFEVIEEKSSPNFDVITSLDPYAIPGAFELTGSSDISNTGTLNSALINTNSCDPGKYNINTNGLGENLNISTSEVNTMGWNSQLAFNFDEWNDYVGQCVAGIIATPSGYGNQPIFAGTGEPFSKYSSVPDDYTTSPTYSDGDRAAKLDQQGPVSLENIDTGSMPILPTTEYVSNAELAMAYDLISHQNNETRYTW